jgi:hypothetical protein
MQSPPAGAEPPATTGVHRSVVVRGRRAAELEPVDLVGRRHRGEQRAVHIPFLEVHAVRRVGRRRRVVVVAAEVQLRRVAPRPVTATGGAAAAVEVHIHPGAVPAVGHRSIDGAVGRHLRRHVVLVGLPAGAAVSGLTAGRRRRLSGGDEGVSVVVLELVGGEVGGEVWGDGGARRQVRVGEVGAGVRAAEVAGGAVVGDGGLLRGVERAEPVPLLGGRVPDLRRVPAPRPPPHPEVPRLVATVLLLLLLLAALRGLLLRGRREEVGKVHAPTHKHTYTQDQETRES